MGAQRLTVSPADRTIWSTRSLALDRELRQRQDGYQEAVLAHLTLLLVSLSRLAASVVTDLKLNDEPLLGGLQCDRGAVSRARLAQGCGVGR